MEIKRKYKNKENEMSNFLKSKSLWKRFLGPAGVVMVLVILWVALTGKTPPVDVYYLTDADSRRHLGYAYPELAEGVEKAIEAGEIPNDESGDWALIIEKD